MTHFYLKLYCEHLEFVINKKIKKNISSNLFIPLHKWFTCSNLSQWRLEKTTFWCRGTWHYSVKPPWISISLCLQKNALLRCFLQTGLISFCHVWHRLQESVTVGSGWLWKLDMEHCCHWEKPCLPPAPLVGPPRRAALQSWVGLGEECAGMQQRL